MAKWFYYNESGEKIEVTGGQLKGLAKAGKITPSTIVETEDGRTAQARKVKGLTFAEVKQPETVPLELATAWETNPSSSTNNQPKYVAVNFGQQDFDQLIQEDIEHIQKPKQFWGSDPSPLYPPTPPVRPVQVAEENKGSSWQITVFGAVLLLVVGLLGYKILDMFDGKVTGDKREDIVITAPPKAVAETTPKITTPPPTPPKPVQDPRFEQLAFRDFRLRLDRDRNDSYYDRVYLDHSVQNNTGKAV